MLLLVACWSFSGGSAAAEITLTEGEAASTAETPRLQLEFGGESGNVEWVKSLKWRSSALGVFGSRTVSFTCPMVWRVGSTVGR